MTTIAWDGKSIAADGRLTWGDSIYSENECKLYKLDKMIVGGAGTPAEIQQFIHYLSEEEWPSEMPECLQAIVIHSNGKGYFYDSKYSKVPIKKPFATGSGGEIAWGAMMAGADAKKAIEIAAKRDISTGGKITVLSFD